MIKQEKIEYAHGGKVLEAVICFEEGRGPRPGVAVFHAWRGRDVFAIEKAKWLASLGYVGCALDMYGKGVFGSSVEENTKLMEPFVKDRTFLRDRALAGIEVMQGHPTVDREKLGAIGFCFGGMCALDVARSGADVKGVVSLHGLLDPSDEVGNVRAKVLALHGFDDPLAKPEQMVAFENEMNALGADWQLHAYGKTQHAFTNPMANDPKMGTVYSPAAEQRALQATENFLSEVLWVC